MVDNELLGHSPVLRDLKDAMVRVLRVTHRPAKQTREEWALAFLASLVEQAELKVADEEANRARREAERAASAFYGLVNHQLGQRVHLKPAEVDDFVKAHNLKRKEFDRLLNGEVASYEGWRPDTLPQPGNIVRYYTPPKASLPPLLGGVEEDAGPYQAPTTRPASAGMPPEARPVPEMRRVDWRAEAADSSKEAK